MPNEISVRSFPISNIPHDTETWELGASVVGIGQTGEEIVRSLSKAPVQLTCHEVSTRTDGGNGESPSVLAAQLAQEDLVFFVWRALDASEAEVLRALAKASQGDNSLPLLIGVTSEGKESQELADEVKSSRIGLDTLFLLPEASVCEDDQRLSATAEAPSTFTDLARHLVTILTQMSQQKNLICVDLNDVALIVRSGSIGRMGIGVAKGKNKNEIAPRMALKALKGHLAKATGALGIVRDGKKLSVENYGKATAALYPHIPEDHPFIMGLIHDDSMESRVEVTVLNIESSH